MALIILQPNATSSKFLGSGSDVDSVFGTGGNEIVFIADNGKVVLDPSFSAGVDTININGNAGNYDIRVVGSNIVLTSNSGADITIPAGTNGTDIVFLDATRELIIQGGGLRLGSQSIPSDGTIVEVNPGTVIVDPPVDGNTFRLTSTADDFTGTGDNDLFRARVSQVSAGTGAQGNELGSGDYLDGGAGTDTLDAWVQGATTVNGTPGNTSIAPETTDVEILNFRAVRAGGSLGGIDPDDLLSVFFGGLGPKLGVEIDASDMFGVEEIASIQSDESLTVYDVTTLADDGETIRATGDLTVRMDHTGNNTAVGAESDLTILFDRDYLICEDELPTGGQLFIEMMDLDAAILLENGVTVYPAGRSNAGQPIEGPLDDSPYTTIDFTLGTTNYSLNIDVDYNDYPGLLAAVQAAIASQPELAGTIVASLGPDFVANDTDNSPGGSATGRTIVLTNVADDREFTDVTLAADRPGVPGEKDFHLEPYTDVPEGVECKIEIDVVLNKVGRGGDGGELTIGGMVPSLDNVWDQESESGLPELPRGIEQFNVTVEGNDSQDSSLAAIRSTDNWLQCIIIADEGDSEADLVIGNRNTAYDGFDPLFADGILGGISIYQFINGGGLLGDVIGEFIDLTDPLNGDLSSVKNNAIKDVLVFDASAFDNDTETHAFFSDEVVDKYLNISDDEPTTGNPVPDATVDNADGDAVWTFGEGVNVLNVNISQTNMAVEGTATREDFSFSTFTNGGNDLVQIQLGNGDGRGDESGEEGDGGTIEAWYHNHLLNENLYINTGSGDDKVETWGSTAAEIILGTGNDVAFTDNSGIALSDDSDVGVYNFGRATWVFNTLPGSLDVTDLASATPTSISNVANLQLRVTFQDIESLWVEVGNSFGSIDGRTITDLTINQAIKAAINSDPILSELVVAEDGPGRSLIVRSLIDGSHEEVDFEIDLRTDPTPFTPAQVAGAAITFDAAAGLAALGFNADGSQAAGQRFESEFGNDDGPTLDGFDSINPNNNTVEGGLGNDLIVLSSDASSIETIDINGLFDNDVILNFTAGIADLQPEIQTITFTGDDPLPAGTATITLNGVEYEIDIDDTDGPDDVAAAAATAINDADNGFTAAAAGGVVTITAIEEGVNYDPASVEFEANDPDGEIQELTFSGQVNGGETVTVSFANPDGTTNVYSVLLAAGDDVNDLVASLAAQFNADADVIATFTMSDPDTIPGNGDEVGTLTLENVNGGNVAPAVVTIETSGDNDIVVERTDTQDGSDYPADADVVTVQDGTIFNSGGFDIFDVTTVLQGPVSVVFNDQPTLAPGSGDGLERGTVGDLLDTTNGVAIIDTVEQNDVPSATAGLSELAYLQQIATLEDTASGAGTGGRSIAITVNDDNVGTFYLIVDGTAAGDAQVTRLGSAELGQYDVIGKENIGNWDQMSISNFTPLSAAQLSGSYAGVDFG